MTVDAKIKALAVCALLIVLTALGFGAMKEHEARVKAEATQAADEKIIAANQQAIASRDASTAKVTAALAAQSAAIQTPQQAAQVVLRYLPAPVAPAGQPAAVPAPIPVVQSSQLSDAIRAELPAAPSYGILTQQQLVAQARADLACQATTDNLQACAADKADLQKSLAAETTTANSWEATAKGGTKLQRFMKVLKYVGCAAGGAVAGNLADKTHPATGSAIGGATGVAACSLF